MGRRAKGLGSVRQLPSGRWQGRIMLPGRAAPYTTSHATKTGAERALRDAYLRAERGQLPGDGRLTVNQWLDTWLADVVKPERAPRTYETYEQYCRLYLRPHLGKLKLVKLNASDVQRMLRVMQEAGLSPKTRNHARTILSVALTVAVRFDLLDRNVAMLTAPPTVRRTPRRALSGEDGRAILAAVKGSWLFPIVLTALGLGLRQEEVLGLTWPCVDFERGEVRIERVLYRARTKNMDGVRPFSLLAPKNDGSQRVVPLPGIVGDALRAQPERGRVEPHGDWHQQLVFCSTAGAPLDGTYVTHRFQAFLVRAGLPVIRFHDLRHGTASFLCSLGVPIHVAMRILGHAQASMLLSVYAHAHDDDLRKAMDALNDLLAD